MPQTETKDWRATQRSEAKELRKLVIDAEVAQGDVAAELDMSGPRVSEYLNGRRRWPDDFPKRFKAAVKRAARS